MLHMRNRHVGTEIQETIFHKLENPLRQLAPFIVSIVPTVGKDHETIIGFAPNHATNALDGLAEGIKIEKILFLDLVVGFQVLQPGPQDVGYVY